MESRPVQTTVLSLDGDALARPDERRGDERFLTLYRVGSLAIGERRELCLIKNVSAGGMRIRAYSDLAQGLAVAIELKSGQPVSGQVSWVDGQDAGVSFDQPIDVVDLLSHGADGPRPRMPRIALEATVIVREGAELWRLALCDISQGGLKLRCEQPLQAGTLVVVTLPGLPPAEGRVCWAGEGCIGIAFNRPLPLDLLVGWIRQRQARAG